MISLGITAILTLILCVFFRNARDRTMRLIVGFFWCAMLVFELLDQFVIGTSVVDGILVFNYQWRTFPFQLCNTGLWVMPLIVLMEDGKLRDGIMLYMGLYSLFGGLLTMVYPVTIFVEVLMTDIHTMVHHGSQVVVGIFLLVYNRRKINFRSFKYATAVFISLVGVAVVLNEIGYNLMNAYGLDMSFNMFYISPHYNSGLPVFSTFYELFPWWAYLLTYICVFILLAFAIYFIAVALVYVTERRKKNDKSNTEASEGDAVSTVSVN